MISPAPKRILLLKSNSAGIGDLLRSSAAWRVLKNAYPGVELHMIFFTTEPGYPSEALMKEHPLLNSFSSIDKRTRNFAGRRRFWREVNAVAGRVKPDVVIDFETNGVRLSMVALWMSLRYGCKTIGVGEFPGRGIFYSIVSRSRKDYAAGMGFGFPLHYVERDFVPLEALGLKRNGTPIEMLETAKGAEFRRRFRTDFNIPESVKIIAVNIGCATPDALARRPKMDVLCELLGSLEQRGDFQIVLTGAPFEREVNKEFIKKYSARSKSRIIDLAEKMDISTLTGVIKASSLFISGDTGPYHMAVALKVPVLAMFNFIHPVAHHDHLWVRCCDAEKIERVPELLRNALELLALET